MSTYTLTHKIALSPTCKQRKYFQQAAGVARFTWNWGLAEWKKQVDSGGKPKALALKKQFNAIKPIAFPWMYDVTKYASQQPFIHLQKAFNRFFRQGSGYPQFKRKGRHDSFYLGNDHFEVKGKRIRIPKLGWIKMREPLRFEGRIVSATISRQAQRWFVSIHVELNQAPSPCESQASVGVDLGIKQLATLSNGTVIHGPKPLRGALKKLARAQRQLSRKTKGSSNRHKARMRVARLHASVANIRQDALHKLTSLLTQNYGIIAIEDLNVRGMVSNRRLARAVSDMGLYEFRRQLEYKSSLKQVVLSLADRWFPSSKMCSRCSVIHEHLTLADRTFYCSSCHYQADRDVNAAINLLHTVSSTGFEACGEEGAGAIHMNGVKPASVKQELSTV